MDLPPVDIVTVTYNSAKFVRVFLDGLTGLDYPRDRLHLIVVDNASVDCTRDVLRHSLPSFPFPSDIVELQRNEGFGAACNRGAREGESPFILFLNPDACPAPEMLSVLAARACMEPTIGLIDAAQEPITIPKWRDPGSDDTDWCSGAAVLAKRKAFTEIGGFDPFFFLYAEDVDLSWRMWLKGWRCVYELRARVRHETAPPEGGAKAIETRYTIRYSFSMRLIYDTPGGVVSHLIRGLRYLLSPRTARATRNAVAAGLLTAFHGTPHLLARRCATQAALRVSEQRARFVFTEWYYGRWTA